MVELKRILLATDFSESASLASDYACELSERFGAELHVLHVIHYPTFDFPDFGMGLAFPGDPEKRPEKQRELRMVATEKLKEAVVADHAEAHNVQYAVKFGVPFQEILSYANTAEIDLIVLGTHGRTGISHVLLGSVAERVIQRATCPVFTVRSNSSQEIQA